jgi:hypothetical protein
MIERKLKIQTDHFLKILEKVICNRLPEHVINNILAKEQFGFRKNLTTEKSTYEVSNEIIRAFDKELLVDGGFCDLAKGASALIMTLCCSNYIAME